MQIFLNAVISTILLNFFKVSVLSGDLAITGKEAEEYDRKLSEYIREILENFREQMPEGIPDIGIPPIDPLLIPDVDENIDDGIANMVLRMRHINITGISKFQIRLLKADLEKGFTNFSIAVPELTADGYCYMDGRILGIFPITGDGPFNIHVTQVSIDGYGNLNMSAGGDYSVYMNNLLLNLTFGSIDVEFESLLGGGRWAQTLVKLITGLAPKLFMYFHEEAMVEINKALLTLINKELEKGSLKDLLDLIPSP